jgi:hypothetical protein
MSPNVLIMQIELLLIREKFEDSFKLAKFVTSMYPNIPCGWINLSKIYLKLKNFKNCLNALNNVFILNKNDNKIKIKIKSNEKKINILNDAKKEIITFNE